MLLVAAPAHAAVRGLGSWDPIAQRMVRQAGVMPALARGGFGGAQRLGRHAARRRVRRAGRAARRRRRSRCRRTHMSVTRFDALIVEQLGMSDVAQAVQAEAQRAGLRPGPRFGSEVVARQLGLRFNHDSAHDALELYPWEAITRAEAAWSLATALQFDGSQQAYAREVLAPLPAARLHAGPACRAADRGLEGRHALRLGRRDRRRRVVVRLAGPRRLRLLGAGVARLQARPAAGGRAHPRPHRRAMAAEIPRSQRLHMDETQPGDLLFFGRARIWQRVT